MLPRVSVSMFVCWCVCVSALKLLETNLFDNSCVPPWPRPAASDWSDRPAAFQLVQMEDNRHITLFCGMLFFFPL